MAMLDRSDVWLGSRRPHLPEDAVLSGVCAEEALGVTARVSGAGGHAHGGTHGRLGTGWNTQEQ